jgi:hypothetical protein
VVSVADPYGRKLGFLDRPLQSHFNLLLLLFLYIRTIPHFQRMLAVTSCHKFAPHSSDETAAYTSTFTSKPTSLLASITVPVFLHGISYLIVWTGLT